MRVTIIGAGNSGLAMAAHLGIEGNDISLWNRSKITISKLIKTNKIYYEGAIKGEVKINLVTDDMKSAVKDTDLILITTPANTHKEIAEQIAKCITNDALIVLNPGRTFGALEFQKVFNGVNSRFKPLIAETQTIIYTCRKTCEDSVNIIAFKDNVLISTFNSKENDSVISRLPECLREYFIPAKSMIETSIGNVGMILHCAPLLLNAGWTENKSNFYKYYYDGITPSVANLIEKIDKERVAVSEELGYKVETTQEWLKRTYHVCGDNLYECIQNNEVYKTIEAPESIKHRYIFEDVPCGLVPLESIGKRLGLNMDYTSSIIDIASKLVDNNFRENGRNLRYIFDENNYDHDSYVYNLFDGRKL